MRIFFYILIFIIFTFGVSAEEEDRRNLGIGNIDCGPILAAAENISPEKKQTLILYIQGFISGINWYIEDTTTGSGVSDEAIYYSILKYCSENPLKNTNNAAQYIYNELVE